MTEKSRQMLPKCAEDLKVLIFLSYPLYAGYFLKRASQVQLNSLLVLCIPPNPNDRR